MHGTVCRGGNNIFLGKTVVNANNTGKTRRMGMIVSRIETAGWIAAGE
jgi:hypothetical protein